MDYNKIAVWAKLLPEGWSDFGFLDVKELLLSPKGSIAIMRAFGFEPGYLSLRTALDYGGGMWYAFVEKPCDDCNGEHSDWFTFGKDTSLPMAILLAADKYLTHYKSPTIEADNEG